MSIIYKKLISVLFLSCFSCSVYAAKSSSEKQTKKFVSSEKSIRSSKDAFVRGEGPFWALHEYKEFIDAGMALKNEFSNMIQFIKNNHIFVPESSNLGLSCKNNGASYRLKMSFSMDDVEDLQYLFKKSFNHIGSRLKDVRLRSRYNTKFQCMSNKLSAFHTETNLILKSLNFLSQPGALDSHKSESDTSIATDQETDQIRRNNDVIEVKTSLPSNISLEVRLVGGKARDLEPHLDDNTACVFSIDAQGVYESLEWTRKNRKKRYLENGKSYLWFGTAHDIFSSDVCNALNASGVKPEDIVPLAHGVEGKSSNDSENMPISLLLIVKKSDSNKGYIVFPKTAENFQVAIGSRREKQQDKFKKHAK